MLDYTMNEVERKYFILFYEKTGDKLIVHYASGENKIIPYTIESEQRLLSIMKFQVKDANEFLKRANMSYSYHRASTGLFIALIVSGIGIVLITKDVSKSFYVIGTSVTALSGTSFALSLEYKRQYEEVLGDIEKNKYFLKNEKLINTYLRKIENNPDGNFIPMININTISKFSKEELEDLVADIKRNNFELKKTL